jgi:hypothetical protein
MAFPQKVTLPCGCESVLTGGVYHDEHTCTLQEQRAQHLAEIQQFNDEAERRLHAPLNGDRSFSILRKQK